ncbi:TerB family tellurite resistance protein [Candidatus Marimicrobium litorale]|uniref:Co-chaperone DjlA N-terminal domain-containing protein n=1 Tax=Candidatus Marimicrobium litorale TaxID=2518991 RepID=A0ABT3T9M2_9GAMM|nr:TerB family tellurite resistance protein [Candidatus Marimicrobium litorale]MCX2978530.1 hypothetical protein [Candidatus Marimicrobium litorale]
MEKENGEHSFEGAKFVVGQEDGKTIYDKKFLVSTLLLYVAKGDGEIGPSETDRMINIITNHFDSNSAEAMGLLSDAVRDFSDEEDVVERLRGISRSLDQKERKEIFNMLVKVILADGNVADGELRTAQFAGEILGLSQDAIQAAFHSAR